MATAALGLLTLAIAADAQDWPLHTPGGGALETRCPCLPPSLCPRLFGVSTQDKLLMGNLPICKDSREVRCCGASSRSVTSTGEVSARLQFRVVQVAGGGHQETTTESRRDVRTVVPTETKTKLEEKEEDVLKDHSIQEEDKNDVKIKESEEKTANMTVQDEEQSKEKNEANESEEPEEDDDVGEEEEEEEDEAGEDSKEVGEDETISRLMRDILSFQLTKMVENVTNLSEDANMELGEERDFSERKNSRSAEIIVTESGNESAPDLILIFPSRTPSKESRRKVGGKDYSKVVLVFPTSKAPAFGGETGDNNVTDRPERRTSPRVRGGVVRQKATKRSDAAGLEFGATVLRRNVTLPTPPLYRKSLKSRRMGELYSRRSAPIATTTPATTNSTTAPVLRRSTLPTSSSIDAVTAASVSVTRSTTERSTSFRHPPRVLSAMRRPLPMREMMTKSSKRTISRAHDESANTSSSMEEDLDATTTTPLPTTIGPPLSEEVDDPPPTKSRFVNHNAAAQQQHMKRMATRNQHTKIPHFNFQSTNLSPTTKPDDTDRESDKKGGVSSLIARMLQARKKFGRRQGAGMADDDYELTSMGEESSEEQATPDEDEPQQPHDATEPLETAEDASQQQHATTMDSLVLLPPHSLHPLRFRPTHEQDTALAGRNCDGRTSTTDKSEVPRSTPSPQEQSPQFEAHRANTEPMFNPIHYLPNTNPPILFREDEGHAQHTTKVSQPISFPHHTVTSPEIRAHQQLVSELADFPPFMVQESFQPHGQRPHFQVAFDATRLRPTNDIQVRHDEHPEKPSTREKLSFVNHPGNRF